MHRLILFCCLLTSVEAFSQDWVVGGLYSVPYENNTYIVVKIINTDSVGVHLRLFSNVFHKKPKFIDESQPLAVSDKAQKNAPIPAEHVAISHGSFNQWGASFIQKSPVSVNELEAFHDWYEASGGFY